MTYEYRVCVFMETRIDGNREAGGNLSEYETRPQPAATPRGAGGRARVRAKGHAAVRDAVAETPRGARARRSALEPTSSRGRGRPYGRPAQRASYARAGARSGIAETMAPIGWTKSYRNAKAGRTKPKRESKPRGAPPGPPPPARGGREAARLGGAGPAPVSK